METLTKLAKVAAELSAIDTKRESKMRERDRLVREARDAGITWVVIQQATGLSARAVALSLERTAPNR
jgi:hypothetical protein